MNIEPETLEGKYVRLEPLSADAHLEGLCKAGVDSSIFDWFDTSYSTPERMQEFVESALSAQTKGTALPFATVLRETGAVIGSTRFCAIAPPKAKVEIGWTWLTPNQHRTPANTEAKYLMLRHAFEEWDCTRVEFETAAKNRTARRALERIGATEEGTLRKHMIIHGDLQDSVFFSILDTEWRSVKRDLEVKLEA